jgi:hypothetical protein
MDLSWMELLEVVDEDSESDEQLDDVRELGEDGDCSSIKMLLLLLSTKEVSFLGRSIVSTVISRPDMNQIEANFEISVRDSWERNYFFQA